MIKNFVKIAFRNLVKNKVSAFINIGGLAVGMAVAILISLWAYDELSFDKDNKSYSHIAQVMQHISQNSQIDTWDGLPYPLANALRINYENDFKSVVLINRFTAVFSYNDKKIAQNGMFTEPQGPDLLDIKMLSGTHAALADPTAILLSASSAYSFFGNEDPISKIIKLEDQVVKVAGVYKDLPPNSSFTGISFIGSWQLKLAMAPGIKTMEDPWGYNGFQILVQVADNENMDQVSAKIKDVKYNNVRPGERIARPALFLQPMSKWRLFGEFKNGINTGGRIQLVWLFATIGVFVLLLACINFMNLSTARSEKRSKEVGVRKAVGSLRHQLIAQFITESVVVTLFSLLAAIILVQLFIPFFNELAEKTVAMPWHNPWFYLIVLSFTFVTGIIAGSYPAFYLSGFKPVKVLKGTFIAGRFASLPRKALVVMQFTVSVVLIIGTIIIYRQIQFAKNRPVGYDRNGLVTIHLHGAEIHDHFEALKNELLHSGSVAALAESGNPVTEFWNSNGGMSWKGKPAGSSADFPMSSVSLDYGRTVDWHIKEGRDFSSDFPSDSSAFIINESAVKFMRFSNPVGEKITFNDGVAFTVIGVVKDFIVESPYAAIRPSLFRVIRGNNWGIVNIRLNPSVGAHLSLAAIRDIFKKYGPDQPFNYEFVDTEYAKKFSDEERIGNLATVFAGLAVFISCLGLFGLASFVAEQRTREIGIRKVLGASVFNLWGLLSINFVSLVLISLLIAIPVSWYFMHSWLQNYQYRVEISWWIFVATGFGAMLITLLTISYQSIKAALMNPVKSLRTE